ncbi:MAG TPA: hypothetical protein VJZ00_04475 [Thermoanaerobaculia bacterium]|nr:hypothetical protein [Thermoanaerobaculia bacterium]
MSGFILRILFSGLIAFVPSENGQQVDVLLLNVGSHYHMSDGSALAPHKPLLIARAGNCTGDCPKRDEEVATFLFRDQSTTAAKDSLEAAVAGGGAWALSGSELSLAKGSSSDPALPSLVIRDDTRGTVNGQPAIIPTTSSEREDFSWVADLQQVCSECEFDPAILDDPPPGLIAARLRLHNGTLYTYSVARIGSDVTPVHFKRLDGTGSSSSYSQAVATWVAADVEIEGDSVEIVEDKFDNGTGRIMTLTPDENGKVEVAILNLPPFVPPASTSNDAPQVGKHFEAYYDLIDTPPDAETRLVPIAGAAGNATYAQVGWADIHPSTALWSDLLNGIRMEIGRDLYDRVLCPPVR